MEYAALVDVYERLDATGSTLELADILATLFEEADPETLPVLVTMARGNVFANWQSDELGVSTSLASDAVVKATGIDAEQVEDWWREEGDLGSAAQRAVANKTQQTLFSEPLTVARVHETLRSLAAVEGAGSQATRVDEISGLLTDADPLEAKYVIRTVVGAMRLGVGEGVIRDAIAQAFLGNDDTDIRAVERAFEVTNDFRVVAEKASSGGRAALATLDVELMRPIKPMLAHNAESPSDALETLGTGESDEVLLEVKYDGIRAKVHRDHDDLRIFTRRVEDVTEQFPDIVEAVDGAVDADTFILEAEVVGYDPDTGDPVPFQELSQRIRRKYDIQEMSETVPARVYVFDCIHLGGTSLLEDPLRERLSALDSVFTPREGTIERAASQRASTTGDIETFYESALADGREGIMVKSLDATYQPGSRVGYQLKLKPTMESLDLVVPRAKWSEGRKSEYLGRPFLACRDASDSSLKEVGRMHSGFTDKQLEEFHDLVEPRIESVDGREAQLTPEVVLEVEYEEIQESTKYDSGYALRFPRLSQIRHDIGVDAIDTLDKVERLFDQQ